jgi:hypothetical protein
VQVWDFSRVIQNDLSNFDEHGAWPTLIDEYVISCRSQAAASSRCSEPPCSIFCMNADRFPLLFAHQHGHKRSHPDNEQADNEATDDLANRLSSLLPGSGGNLAAMGTPALQGRSKRCKLQLTSRAMPGRECDNLTGVTSYMQGLW